MRDSGSSVRDSASAFHVRDHQQIRRRGIGDATVIRPFSSKRGVKAGAFQFGLVLRRGCKSERHSPSSTTARASRSDAKVAVALGGCCMLFNMRWRSLLGSPEHRHETDLFGRLALERTGEGGRQRRRALLLDAAHRMTDARPRSITATPRGMRVRRWLGDLRRHRFLRLQTRA